LTLSIGAERFRVAATYGDEAYRRNVVSLIISNGRVRAYTTLFDSIIGGGTTTRGDNTRGGSRFRNFVWPCARRRLGLYLLSYLAVLPRAAGGRTQGLASTGCHRSSSINQYVVQACGAALLRSAHLVYVRLFLAFALHLRCCGIQRFRHYDGTLRDS